MITQDSSSLSMGLSLQDQLEAETQEPISTEGVEVGKGMYGGSLKALRKAWRGFKRFTKNAIGTVIESSLDKGKGFVTNMLVEAGTMKVGDVILVGRHYGREMFLLAL